jgi:hypothetical protein
MQQGLFAFDGDQFFVHYQETPELDHVMWFERIGLPGHGPGYDALLRGKVLDDVDTGRIIIGFYNAAYLSNRRYAQVVEAFGLAEHEDRVVEKRLSEAYS